MEYLNGPPSLNYVLAGIYGRIIDVIARRVRHCICGDDLVLETDHLRVRPGALPRGPRERAREFFQVVVSPTRDGLQVWGRRIVAMESFRADGECERIELSFSVPRRDARCVREVGATVAAIVASPDRFLPSSGHRFPKTGMPRRMDEIKGSRPTMP